MLQNVQIVREYDDYGLKQTIRAQEQARLRLAQDHEELTEETTQHIQALSDKYEVLEAAVFGPGGMQEQILSLKKQLERLPAVSHSTRELRTTAAAPTPSPGVDTAAPK